MYLIFFSLKTEYILRLYISIFFQDVKFPLTLDLFDLCTPELQQKLGPMRELFKEQEDKLALTAKVV